MWPVSVGPDRLTGRVQLSPALTEKVRRFPEVYIGVWRVRVVCADGTTYPGVELGWSGEVIGVVGHKAVPFAASDVVDVRDDSGLSD